MAAPRGEVQAELCGPSYSPKRQLQTRVRRVWSCTAPPRLQTHPNVHQVRCESMQAWVVRRLEDQLHERLIGNEILLSQLGYGLLDA